MIVWICSGVFQFVTPLAQISWQAKRQSRAAIYANTKKEVNVTVF